MLYVNLKSNQNDRCFIAYHLQLFLSCRGVNMYAMLTGKLPYSAEPFHITTLYNKMKRNDMNPIPDHLSSCKFIFITVLSFLDLFEPFRLFLSPGPKLSQWSSRRWFSKCCRPQTWKVTPQRLLGRSAF